MAISLIIAIGEKTRKLSENEISAIKTVVQKIRTRSNVDPKRLQIVKEALDKMKRFSLVTDKTELINNI